MRNLKNFIIIIFLISIYTFFCAYSYVQAVSNNLKESVLRLHVIANSDSKEDQNLKLLVKDNLLKYMNELCINCSSKEDAMLLVNNHLNDFKEIAKNTILQTGYSYDVNIEIDESEFPTKNYGDISLPAGIYDALKVKIGKAQGQNWWCVMFPPLCFVDISSGVVPDDSKEILEKELTDEEFSIISDNSDSNIAIKFKLLELFSNSKMITAKN